ncbi:hypothetical protein JCM8097_008893 [Rhodosporidiobolus ruineniae]
MPVKLSERLKDRLRLVSSTQQQAPPEERLRIPLELILHIVDLASSSCYDDTDRDRLHASLACVNRPFSRLYSRRKWRTVGLPNGTQVEELLERLKVDKAGSDWIEGVEVEFLVHQYSRRQLVKNWAKLSKQCRNLQFVQLGDPDVEPNMHESFSGRALHDMAGISTLRLISLCVHHDLPASRFLRRSLPQTPCIPLNLRHLTLDGVQLSGLDYASPERLATLWPPADQLRLTSLYIANLQKPGYQPARSDLVPAIRDLVARTSPTLKALHYSRKRSVLDPDPSLFLDLRLPLLRILSISLYHFDEHALHAAPSVEHLVLTLEDYSPDDFAATERKAKEASALLGAALSPTTQGGVQLPKLRRLHLPVFVGATEPERRSLWAELRTAAEEQGVRVEVYEVKVFDDEDKDEEVETRFRLLVRDELYEKM